MPRPQCVCHVKYRKSKNLSVCRVVAYLQCAVPVFHAHVRECACSTQDTSPEMAQSAFCRNVHLSHSEQSAAVLVHMLVPRPALGSPGWATGSPRPALLPSTVCCPAWVQRQGALAKCGVSACCLVGAPASWVQERPSLHRGPLLSVLHLPCPPGSVHAPLSHVTSCKMPSYLR